MLPGTACNKTRCQSAPQPHPSKTGRFWSADGCFEPCAEGWKWGRVAWGDAGNSQSNTHWHSQQLLGAKSNSKCSAQGHIPCDTVPCCSCNTSPPVAVTARHSCGRPPFLPPRSPAAAVVPQQHTHASALPSYQHPDSPPWALGGCLLHLLTAGHLSTPMWPVCSSSSSSLSHGSFLASKPVGRRPVRCTSRQARHRVCLPARQAAANKQPHERRECRPLQGKQMKHSYGLACSQEPSHACPNTPSHVTLAANHKRWSPSCTPHPPAPQKTPNANTAPAARVFCTPRGLLC
jgi:hypothetical protein